VLTLNRDYRYDGVSLDLNQLFRLWDCTEIAETLLPQVEQNVAAFTRMLGGDTAPVILPGEQCFTPYDCAYYAHCTRDLVLPEHPITDLPRISRQARERLRADGKDEIPQVPDDFRLTQLQKRVWKAVVTNAEYISNDLGAALRTIRYPVYHLDFETFMPAIPRYAGTRPYDAIPFQYSLHIENTGGSIEHVEFLHTGDSDPRELLIVSLIEALGDRGSVCVYSSYEKQVLGKLANEFPRYAESLWKISNRLWDLLPVVRDHYYHPDLHGSFSIKKVLPVLLPNLGYDDLEIKDGQMAGVSYLKSLAMVDLVERERIYTALKMYCGMDTVAMVRLRARLLEIHEKFSHR
jgi:hypothetical protein